MQKELPSEITFDWAGQQGVVMHLRHALPKIWTQAQSRPFGIYWSEALGLGKLHPEPTPEELSAFYDLETYREYLSGFGRDALQTRSLWDRMITKLAWLTDRSEGQAPEFLADHVGKVETACDVGCGSGSLLSDILESGASVTGVDPSDVSVAALQRKGIEAYCGTAEDLPEGLEGRVFDLVIMLQSLEHCLDPARALRNMRRLCGEGGYFLVEVPNHENAAFDKYGPAWFHTDAGRHLYFFQAGSLCRALEHAGFEPVHVGYLSYTRQFGPEWNRAMREAWDCLFADVAHPPVRRPSGGDPARDLLGMSLLPRARKYDVLRVLCRARPLPD